MLLAIDVGNTNIVLGVFEGTTLVRSWRLLTLRERTADEIGLMVAGLFAHEQIVKIIGSIEELRTKAGLPAKELPPEPAANPLKDIFKKKIYDEKLK